MMKRYTYYILLLAFFVPVCSWAQTERADSLLKLFDNQHTVSVANQLFDLFDAEELTDSHIQMTEKTPVDTMRQQVWYWAAEYYNQHQQYKKASDCGLKALPLCETGDNRIMEGDCLAILAISLLRQGDFHQAIGYAKRCNELDREVGDPNNIASSLNLLAAVFMASYQHEEAERCILEGLEYAAKAGDTGRLAILNGMACEVYYYQNQYNSALNYGRKALEIEQQLGRKDKIAMRQSQVAGALIGMQQMDEARQLLDEALPVLHDSNPHSYAIACNQMGDILLNSKKNSEAAGYFNKALQILMSQNDLYNEGHSRRGLYLSLRNTNPTQAMTHIDRYMQLRDSIYNLRTSALVTQYAALLGNQRLQAEKAELQRQHRTTLLIGTAGFLLVVGLIMFLAHYRIRREQHRIAELTQQIEELSEAEPDNGNSNQEFLMKLVSVVNQQLSQGQLGVEQVAEQMNMSATTLRRQLMQATGESPKAYFTAIQMRKATNLLTTTDSSVADIALQCGYQEVSSFIRAFKRIYGVSPSQYLKR